MEHNNILELILDGKEPTCVPLHILDDITAHFSNRRVIGHGGFGVVYKVMQFIFSVQVKI
jgi:hypothetical protein